MGSGNNNRKNSDTTIVRIPKASSTFGSLANSNSAGSVSDNCIPSFDVLIKDVKIAQVGVKAYLQKETVGYSVTVGNLIVGSVPVKYSKIVASCLDLGVRYTGEIILMKNKKYARFIRLL